MQMIILILPILSVVFQKCSTTTEWWGDKRAHLYPPRAPAFYDLAYDETECPSGLRSIAIPDYVYFGIMLATFSVDEHDECLRRCLEKPRCKSVNFFQPLTYQEKGFCELLSETQHDNPRLLRPFKRAVHYEKIRCRQNTTIDSADFGEDIIDVQIMPVTTPAASQKIPGHARPLSGRLEQSRDLSALMKKLSAKVSEFNHQSVGEFRA